MDISSALKRTGREDITLRSIISQTIQEYYFERFEKKVEIDSVQIRGKKILIRTGNNLINSELLYLRADIESRIIERIKAMKLSLGKEIELRFIA